MEVTTADMKKVEDKIDAVADDVHEIKQLLMGNQFVKSDTGFFGKINDIETRLEILEKWKYTIIVIIIVAGILSGWKITDLIMKLK